MNNHLENHRGEALPDSDYKQNLTQGQQAIIEIDRLMSAQTAEGKQRWFADPDYVEANKQRLKELIVIRDTDSGLEDPRTINGFDRNDDTCSAAERVEEKDFIFAALQEKDQWGRQRMSTDADFREMIYDTVEDARPELMNANINIYHGD